MTLRFLQLDVFSARPGGGNPLGVVFGAQDWSTERMQGFAAYTDLVETTFVLPATQAGADYRLRIFSPSKEIPFAGHPTIGSAHAVLETEFATLRAGLLVQECAVGLLKIQADQRTQELFVAAPLARVLQTGMQADPMLARILAGRRIGAIAPGMVDGGRRWWVAELADEAQLRDWQVDHAAILALARATDSMGLCAFARSATSASKATSPKDHYQLVVRAFPAGVGIVEDPASGAANGLLAAYIKHFEPNGALASGYTVSQGREMGHDATLRIRFSDERVWVGGQTHTVIDGSLRWPEMTPL
jgi:PhzF family phenazine biosynthesis protein